MKKSKITQKDILFFSISLFAIVVAWVAFSLYHSFVTTTISENLQMQIVPIEPKFDTATIEILKQREKVEPLFEFQLDSSSASTPAALSPTPEEEIETTEEPLEESEEPSPTEEPTSI